MAQVASVPKVGTCWLWRRRVALVLGLVLGTFWFFWGVFDAISYHITSGIIEAVAVGGTLLMSTAVGARWPLAGGALLTAAGLSPFVFAAVSGRGAPLAILFLGLPPLVAGLLFLSLGRGAPRRAE